MRIALNWFEVTLPTTELAVPTQAVEPGEQSRTLTPKSRRYGHRVVQRREGMTTRLLHVTDIPPNDTTVEMIKASEDASFVKIAIEEGFSQLLGERRYVVFRKQVGSNALLATDESLWPDIYTFWRGLSFRGFYFTGATGVRWGLILNYATSQRFTLTLDDSRLLALALGKRVLRVDDAHDAEEDQRGRSGILLSAVGGVATVDFGKGDPVQVPANEWTLPCRRDLLSEFIIQTKGQREGAELTRRLQQATFCLTDMGRMNTSLARSQLVAIQQLLQHSGLGRIILPLPTRPPASLSSRPLMVGD
jgi:hypothetical protein